jgi:23S rRNA (cytidine1920-2'-O)/16S rRNA (cytidine1409-2'-O)-methyltransferase
VGKGGIVTDAAAHRLAVDAVAGCVRALKWEIIGMTDSPITGTDGNQEFLLVAGLPA